MTDVRLTALNPVDSQVYPVACNTSGELLVAQDDPGPDLTVTGDLTVDGTASFKNDVYIDSSGRLLVGTTTVGFNTADNLTVADSGDCGITIRSGASSSGSIYFADGTTGSAEYEGFIDYQQTAGNLRFGTGGGQERLRITSSGNIFIGGTTASSADIALNANGTATFLGDVTAPNITSLMNTVAELTNRIDILEGN